MELGLRLSGGFATRLSDLRSRAGMVIALTGCGSGRTLRPWRMKAVEAPNETRKRHRCRVHSGYLATTPFAFRN